MKTVEDKLHEALALMESALALLDEADEALDVAAHLDLAVHRLRELMTSSPL
ncbi:hypothetical protein G7077_12660 [Sphingomonas piscis]|uniref:Uncharacterized protein n=1 Tax=Sphingomonas piscis TaxID=2714943 RepID=A0A6G7YSC1_9SPHN|nr:hypothetical protein [Sphingomonas piscis]QIK79629.1 hypothetical protein G7077_12660 [Sphingomonas piscis]